MNLTRRTLPVFVAVSFTFFATSTFAATLDARDATVLGKGLGQSVVAVIPNSTLSNGQVSTVPGDSVSEDLGDQKARASFGSLGASSTQEVDANGLPSGFTIGSTAGYSDVISFDNVGSGPLDLTLSFALDGSIVGDPNAVIGADVGGIIFRGDFAMSDGSLPTVTPNFEAFRNANVTGDLLFVDPVFNTVTEASYGPSPRVLVEQTFQSNGTEIDGFLDFKITVNDPTADLYTSFLMQVWTDGGTVDFFNTAALTGVSLERNGALLDGASVFGAGGGNLFELAAINRGGDVTPSPVPLPASLPLFLIGLTGLGLVARRRRPH